MPKALFDSESDSVCDAELGFFLGDLILRSVFVSLILLLCLSFDSSSDELSDSEELSLLRGEWA